jgi:phosphoglycerate-specific signal transduction histidine kinase
MSYPRPTQQDDIQDELNSLHQPRINRMQWNVTTIIEGLGKCFPTKKDAVRYARELKNRGEQFAIWEQGKLREDIIV